MEIRDCFYVILWLIYLFVAISDSHKDIPKLLLISFDGFRYNYLNKTDTPHFDELIQKGVKAKWINSAYISKTFPNHWSIVTGLYEETHGVIANEMYDPVFKAVFTPEDSPPVEELTKWLDNGITMPIWVANQKEDPDERHSGSIMWPLSQAKIQCNTPTYIMPYNESISFESRVDTMISWFLREKDPINLGVLYYHEPDRTGHRAGPESANMTEMIKTIDGFVGYLIEQLKKNRLFDSLNLLITSDHGMISTPKSKPVELDKYVNRSWYSSFNDTANTVMNILPNPGKADEIYNKLKSVPHLHVYRHQGNFCDVPAQFHYCNNRRIMPLILEAEPGWTIVIGDGKIYAEGNHGYNNSVMEMHPFFIAHGPAFKKGYLSEPFNNVDIYPLMCKVLDIKKAHTGSSNGSLANVLKILKPEQGGHMRTTMLTYIGVVLFASAVAGLFSIMAVRQTHRFHRRVIRKPVLLQAHDPDGSPLLPNHTLSDDEL